MSDWKPTLYADDARLYVDTSAAPMCQRVTDWDFVAGAVDRFARILPRRCRNCWGNPGDCMDCVLRHVHDECGSVCPICDGLGFLYPDPPDGKPVVRFGPIYVPWVDWCESVWVRLGIVEPTDG